MHAVIAEDPSDVETLAVLIRRLSHNRSIPIKGKGYGGCGELLTKGARQLRLFQDIGCKRFMVCSDADGPSGVNRRQEILDKIIKPSGIPRASCLPLVPVQEIEAWILADLHQAIPKVIPSWKPAEVAKPETIASPKEELQRLSRGSNKKPRYDYTVHNPRVAEYLDFPTVEKKCPSFRPLHRFVAGSRPIKLPAEPFPGSGGRSLWAYSDPETGPQYLSQVATASDWGVVIAHVQELDDPPVELSRLCEYGWAKLETLDAELITVLASRPKGRLRLVLTALQAITGNRQDARYIGLDDGTR